VPAPQWPDPAPDSRGTGLTGSRPPKAAMLVAHRIVRDIGRAGLRPGDLLPPERAMLETYGTGRGTLREALRLLEFQGVIALKPGPGGGPILLNPAAAHLASTLQLLMQLGQASYRVVVEARPALEPVISRLAAGRISNESLAGLAGTVAQMRGNLDDPDRFRDTARRFHGMIAWASGNVLFGYLVEALLGIMDGTVIGIDNPADRRAAILRAHEEIHAAIARHDAAVAGERMREHIEEYARHAQHRFPEILDQMITWDRLPGLPQDGRRRRKLSCHACRVAHHPRHLRRPAPGQLDRRRVQRAGAARHRIVRCDRARPPAVLRRHRRRRPALVPGLAQRRGPGAGHHRVAPEPVLDAQHRRHDRPAAGAGRGLGRRRQRGEPARAVAAAWP
jgi:DNA-binding FadR family transcriptional regulator